MVGRISQRKTALAANTIFLAAQTKPIGQQVHVATLVHGGTTACLSQPDIFPCTIIRVFYFGRVGCPSTGFPLSMQIAVRNLLKVLSPSCAQWAVNGPLSNFGSAGREIYLCVSREPAPDRRGPLTPVAVVLRDKATREPQVCQVKCKGTRIGCCPALRCHELCCLGSRLAVVPGGVSLSTLLSTFSNGISLSTRLVATLSS